MSNYEPTDEVVDYEVLLPPSRHTGPAHYTGLEIQPWDAMESWMSQEEFVGFLRGNVIKYMARAPRKGGVEDYRKAMHYLTKLLSVLDQPG